MLLLTFLHQSGKSTSYCARILKIQQISWLCFESDHRVMGCLLPLLLISLSVNWLFPYIYIIKSQQPLDVIVTQT